MMMTLALALLAGQEIKDADPIAAIESATVRAVEKAAPAVVAIKVEREPEAPKPAAEAPRRNPFRGMPFNPMQDVFANRPKDAWCSGVVIEADGTILTTHFNVAGKVRSIKVLLPDGRELEAKILGFNGTYDLAALKVEAAGLATLQRAPVEAIKTGHALLALGRAPDGKGLTANPGIVSAASRLGGRGIQLDAKLNYGNVGGPVVDLEGRLVGVSCKVDTKFSSTRGQNSGVGYAITHDRLPEILKELKEGRSVAESRRPLLGIVFNQKSVKKGVELESVQPGGAAEKAGIKAGDVIVEFDGTAITYFDELRATIMRKAPGERVKVKVLRGEEALEFDCELGWDDRGE
ncbi:MAG TPA: trypsin-like peptidase domain-containing protein [Planctomycetota bacterium]